MKKINIFLIFYFFISSTISFSDDSGFDKWKNSFKKYALTKNISEDTFNVVMKNVKFLPKVIEYDRYQPEFYEDTFTYISKRTSNTKLNKGIKLYNKNSDLYNNLALSFLMLNKAEKAGYYAEKSLSINPESAIANYIFSTINRNLKNISSKRNYCWL